MLVTKAEVATRTAYVGHSRPDFDDTRSQSIAPSECDAATRSVHSPVHNSTSLGLNNVKRSPAESVLSSNRTTMSPKDGEAGSIGARDRRKTRGGGSVARSLGRRRSSSLDSDDDWSEIADAVTGDSSKGIESFLLPEEEQVRWLSDLAMCYERICNEFKADNC